MIMMMVMEQCLLGRLLIRGGNVRPSVRPTSVHKKVCPISMKVGKYIEVDE